MEQTEKPVGKPGMEPARSPDKPGPGMKPGGSRMMPGGAGMSGMGMGSGGSGAGFRLAAFSSLRIRSFRWLWFGNFFAFNSMQMQMVARGWLVYAMTDSPMALGIVGAGFGLPLIIFSLLGGTVADRVRKRNLLLVTQSLMMIMSLIITLLVSTGSIRLWHLFASSFVAGIIFSFMMPARSAFLVELVEEKDFLNAVSLGSMAMSTCRIASPALAGFLLDRIGIPGVYWIVTLSYLCVILTTTQIPPGKHMEARADVPMMADIMEGIHFVKGNQVLVVLLILAFVPIILAMPYQMLMPVFARTIFNAGPGGMGILMSATGAGALIGSMIVASMGGYERKGILMVITGTAFGVFLVPFAMAGALVQASICLIFVGGFSSVFMMLNTTLLMTNTPEELMGRVMSIFMMTFGVMPVGTLLSGSMAELVGAPLTVAGGGVLMSLFLIVLVICRPILRRL